MTFGERVLEALEHGVMTPARCAEVIGEHEGQRVTAFETRPMLENLVMTGQAERVPAAGGVTKYAPPGGGYSPGGSAA